jgi:dGTPase
LSDRNERYHRETKGGDYRTPAQLDRDRVLYSSAFSRLMEITQVVSADRGYVFHNRLTHSLKVAQLARRMSERFQKDQPRVCEAVGGVDPDAAEAAALAHDLGHPPYGHIAETTLNRLAREQGLPDGFEGNAQSFRIVSKLAVSDAIGSEEEVRGLNLTRATLNGILKYPWIYHSNPQKQNKWGAYESERQIFEWARKGSVVVPFTKCAEAELMDWADDITYAVHDLLDFFCAGQIPLERLADDSDSSEKGLFFAEVFNRCPDLESRRSELETVFEKILELFPLDRRYTGTLKERTDLWQFATVLISRFVNAIRLVIPKTGGRLVEIGVPAQDEIRMLKELTWHYVILNAELSTVQYGQQQAVQTVFGVMIEAARSGRLELFPPLYRDELSFETDSRLRNRIVVDYVAGMTERELARMHATLTGRT